MKINELIEILKNAYSSDETVLIDGKDIKCIQDDTIGNFYLDSENNVNKDEITEDFLKNNGFEVFHRNDLIMAQKDGGSKEKYGIEIIKYDSDDMYSLRICSHSPIQAYISKQVKFVNELISALNICGLNEVINLC